MLRIVLSLDSNLGKGDGDVTDPLVVTENKQVLEAVREEKQVAAYSGWVELFRPCPNLRGFTLALCLPAIQQFTGINAITHCKQSSFRSQ